MAEIKGVEIFSVGEWNGDEYSKEDLMSIVQAFEENSVGSRPHLKLGHDPKQKLLQEDGYPAAGWVDRLYIMGEKLVADFSGIPEKIYQIIQNKGYRKVSSEIFWNIKIGDKTYNRMLAGVALLGADFPGVMNLNDIIALYSATESPFETIKQIEFSSNSQNHPNEGGEMKTEEQVKLELELAKKDGDLKTYAAKVEEMETAQKAKDAELEDLKTFKAAAEKEKVELLAQAEVARIDKFVTELAFDKLCTPAMKPLITELLGADKKEYSVTIAEKETKLSKEDLLKEALKLFKAAAEVNFEENSLAGDEGSEDNKDVELDKKAKEYAAEKKISYGQALKIVMKENQK